MLNIISGSLGLLLSTFFAVAPSSTNYTLRNYDFGNGGDSSSSTNFGLNSLVNGLSGNQASSTTYKVYPGIIPTQNANVPPAPTFTNPSHEYNRLRITLNEGNNPDGTNYAIAISDDSFATTLYIQPDFTIGSSYSISNYQDYTTWGGASGFWVLGLETDTTYDIKVKALNGDYSGSAFGPTAAATTEPTTISFAIETSTSPTPPYNVAFTNLAPGSVVTADADINVSISSNARFGGKVYVKDDNSGLSSLSASYIINSATANLAVASQGYGAQVTNTNQTEGGPLLAVSPFDSGADSVGALSTTQQAILSSVGYIDGGSAVVRLKAKSNIAVPSSGDYADSLTLIAATSF